MSAPRQVVTARNPRILGMVAAWMAGSTMTAIGAEYGLSRERVRQLLAREGYTGKRFPGQHAIAKAPGHRNAAKSRARKAKRRQDSETLRALAATLGRTPTLQELATAVGLRYPGGVVNHWLVWTGGKRRRHEAAIAIRRLYRAAGLAPA